LGFVWRETGAVRNVRPSRGQAAARPEEDSVEEKPLSLDCNGIWNLCRLLAPRGTE
jgi:hypothetical protein